MEPQPQALNGYTPLEPLGTERTTRFAAAEQVLTPGADYRALIVTSKGPLVLDLFQDAAPATVNNFVFLARHRFYDGVVFHRVLDGFMAQTGDPTGSGRGGPGYTFDDEFGPGLSHDGKGVLSMANAGPGTNGSQFFITFDATPWLDGRHAVFGRVVEGDEVLDALTRIDPGRPGGTNPDVMERVTVYVHA
jgi:cyclophilin family peptidyl-prolyl cis-trans isomerase